RKGDRINSVWVFQTEHATPRGGIPQNYIAVIAAGRERPSTWRERYGADAAGMRLPGMDKLAMASVPEDDAPAVVGCGERLAVGQKKAAVDEHRPSRTELAMFLVAGNLLPSGGIPEAYPAGHACDDEASAIR